MIDDSSFIRMNQIKSSQNRHRRGGSIQSVARKFSNPFFSIQKRRVDMDSQLLAACRPPLVRKWYRGARSTKKILLFECSNDKFPWKTLVSTRTIQRNCRNIPNHIFYRRTDYFWFSPVLKRKARLMYHVRHPPTSVGLVLYSTQWAALTRLVWPRTQSLYYYW